MDNSAISGCDKALGIWAGPAGCATQKSVAALSRLVNLEITIRAIEFKLLQLAQASELIGRPEDEVVATYVGIMDGATGHIMIIMSKQSVFTLADILLDRPAGEIDQLSQLETSIISEVGNIMGAYFLASVADGETLTIRPMPPEIAIDMGGAILDPILADMITGDDEVFALKATFTSDARDVEGAFLILPGSDLIQMMASKYADHSSEEMCSPIPN